MALAFFVSGIVYVYFGRWRVTHMDYWKIYDVCLDNTWLKSALFKYGGHSLFFPMFLQLANLHFFHGSQQFLFFAGLTLLLISVSLLLIPVWRDQTASLTAKIVSTLIVIVGSFWMGRAAITTSGGFNCENSSVMVGATLAFLLLPKMCDDSSRLLSTALILLCAGFVASFSMAIGLAIWPTLLVLAWCLRLPRHLMVMLAVAGLAAAIIFVLLPPSPYDLSPLQGIHWRGPSAVYTTIVWLCRLIGSPVSYTVFAWWPDKSFHHLIESSGLALWSGAGGLVLAATAALPQLSQHKIRKSTLQFTGLALVIF